jgi:hypothetical protein
MRSRRNTFWLLIIALTICFVSGCVTYTEHVYPQESIPQDESLWDEIRREFSWRKNETSSSPKESQTSLYQEMKETVSGWFDNHAEQPDTREIEADRRRFERQRQGALRQLQEQQQLNELKGNKEGD